MRLSFESDALRVAVTVAVSSALFIAAVRAIGEVPPMSQADRYKAECSKACTGCVSPCMSAGTKCASEMGCRAKMGFCVKECTASVSEYSQFKATGATLSPGCKCTKSNIRLW